MRQSILKIQFPEGAAPLRPGDFREMLAKGGDGSPLLPAAFFHYDEAGRPLSAGAPAIRIVGGRTWVGVLSMAEESPLFDQAVGIASRIASKHYGRPLPIRVETPEFGITATEYPVTYFLRDMAIKRRRARARAQSIDDIVRERISDGLARYAAAYGLDVPKTERLGIIFHDLRNIGMQLRVREGSTNEFVTLVNGEFSMHADLAGIWQVGNLQSRGYGRIIRKGAWTGGAS